MEVLCDPENDRVCKSLTPPPHRPLSNELMFPSPGQPNWKLIQEHLQNQGTITKSDFILLIDLVSSIFRKERNLLELQDPVTVVGDIHGQFYDLLRVQEKGGNPEDTQYIYLGDYVDRGSFSIEVIILLFTLKISFPKTIYMIRGNHECRAMTSFFNFRQECLHKYDLEIYDRLMDCFDTLPLAWLINGKFLAVHGGLSPELTTLEGINTIDRYIEPPREGLYCDILWSDPVDSETGQSDQRFEPNQIRGCSYYYNASAVNDFLHENNLLSIIRAHEAAIDGYKLHKWDGSLDFPSVITVFSAPNYWDVYHNKGAIIKFMNDTLTIEQYGYTEHPYLLPNFSDIFTWSVPFVAEKVLEIFANIMSTPRSEEQKAVEEAKANEEEGNEKEEAILPSLISTPPSEETQATKYEVLRRRIGFVGKMVKLVKILREENESIVQLKGFCPDNKIPKGLLFEGHNELENAVAGFANAKNADQINEKLPE